MNNTGRRLFIAHALVGAFVTMAIFGLIVWRVVFSEFNLP